MLLKSADEKFKLALLDLLRLLFQYESKADHILTNHWKEFDEFMFSYVPEF